MRSWPLYYILESGAEAELSEMTAEMEHRRENNSVNKGTETVLFPVILAHHEQPEHLNEVAGANNK